MSKLKSPFIAVLASLFLVSCSDDDYKPIVEEVSPVVFDLGEVPYQSLSEYKFYEGAMNQMEPAAGVLPYELINSLFTDYAQKKRFVWMPEGSTARYVQEDQILEFPVGAVMIKNFYYSNVLPSNEQKIIETRLIYRTEAGWEFADYIWNDEQTDAFLDNSGRNINLDVMENGEEYAVDYRVPSTAECLTCHKKVDDAQPIGPKPFNLNKTFSFADGSQNQLQKWEDEEYLTATPESVGALPYWKDQSLTLEQRVRGYTEINCAHCHNDLGHCSYREVRYDFANTIDNESLGVCLEPEELVGTGQTHIVRPGVARRSALYYRISSIDPAERMPLLGRSVVDEEAVQLVEDWINSLDISCD